MDVLYVKVAAIRMRNRNGARGLSPRGVAAWGLTLTALLGALGIQLTPVQASAADRFEVQVSAGYDGYARPDDWAPVRVTIKNNGDDFRGSLRVDDAVSSGSSSGGGFFNKGCCGPATAPVGFAPRKVDIVLPAHSTRHYTLYVAAAQQPRATVLDGSNAVASGQVSPGLLGTGNGTTLVGVVSDQLDSLDQLNLVHLGTGGTVHVVHLKPSEIPSSGVLLRSFDALAFADVSTDSLTGDQKNAIRDYVLSGGGLILVGGTGARKTLSGIPADLQPVTATGATSDDLHAIGGLAGTPAPAGGVEVTTGKLATGAMAIAGGSTPLVAWMRVGVGTVVYTAFDVAAPPVSTWNGDKALLRQLLNRATGTSTAATKGAPPGGNRHAGLDFNSVSSVLNNLPALDVPSLGLVGWLLLLYALAVGPINYFVLKRMRRRHLAWLTIPGMVLVSSTAVLIVGFNVKGAGTQVNQVRVTELTSGSSRRYVVSYSGVVVPHRGDYALALADGSFFGAAPNNFNNGDQRVSIDGDPPQANMPGMTAYAVRTVAAEGYSGGNGQLDSDLHVSGLALTGTITNHTDLEIEDTVVVYRGAFQQLGILRPGHSVDVSLNAGQFRGGDIANSIYPNSGFKPNSTSVDRQQQRRAQVLRGLTSYNFGGFNLAPTLIGFAPSALAPPSVDGARVKVEGENVVTMDIPVAPDARATAIRAGAVVPRLVDFEGDVMTFQGGPNPGASSVHLGPGATATLEFDLPGSGWKSADVGIGNQFNGGQGCLVPQPVPQPAFSSPPGPTVKTLPAVSACQVPMAAAYNFRSGQWDTLATSARGRVALSPADGEVSAEGVVLVRLSSPGDSNVNSADITASRTGPL